MITHHIFDLDGTLFDSSEANVTSYSQAFAEAGLEFNEALYRKSFGLRYKEMITRLAPSASSQQVETVKEAKARFYAKNLHLIKPNNGLLTLAKESAITNALVTTASRVNVEKLLTFFKLSKKVFAVIITGEDVKRGKPDPECYLLAVEKLNTTAQQCIVFEDSKVGIEAATAAGLSFVKVVI